MSEANAPESGALSVDQAIAALNAHEEPETNTPAVESAAEAPAAPEDPAGETSAPEEAAGEAENLVPDAPEGEEAEPAATPLDPPLYWKPEAKAKFATLDPELQAEILAQEGPREASAAKAKAEAAEQVKAAQAELSKLQPLAETLSAKVQQWAQTFQSRWGTQTPDWTAYAQSHGTDAMVLAKTQFEAEQSQLAEAARAAQTAEVQAHEQYVRTEFERLKAVSPELADPEKGPERRGEVTKYLQGLGIPDQALVKISATEMSIARKAMLYDLLQAKAKAAPTPAPKPQAAKPALTRGAAAPGATDPKQARAQTAKRSFAQKRDIASAVALLDSLDE